MCLIFQRGDGPSFGVSISYFTLTDNAYISLSRTASLKKCQMSSMCHVICHSYFFIAFCLILNIFMHLTGILVFTIFARIRINRKGDIQTDEN